MQKYKKSTFIIIIMMTFSLLTISIKSAEALENPVYGNTCGNYQNTGWVAKYKDFVYYAVFDQAARTTSIKRMDSKGKSELIAADDEINGIYNLNIVNDTIYFNNGNESLYRVDIKTKKISRIGGEKDRFARAIVCGDWIYYCDPSKLQLRKANYGEVWRMKLDGSKRELLEKDFSYIYWAYDGWIYYQVYRERTNSKVGYYKMRLDGSDKTKLSFKYFSFPNFDGGWVYYRDAAAKCIYKAKPDGSTKTKLADGDLSDINMSNGWIYYIDKKDKNKMYKIKTNGKGKTLLSAEVAGGIQVVDDWIYYGGMDLHYYRMKVDGSNKSVLN